MANGKVPRIAEVIPGAIVNIILKADQRTGRQVSGTVRDVLTRGDHHRGIKVRLTDGRIGRVQSIGSGSITPSSGSGSAALVGSTMSSTDEQVDLANRYVSHPRGRRGRYRDMRLEEPAEEPPQQADLSAYIVPAKRKGKGKKGQGASGQQDGTARSEGVSGSNESNSSVDVISAVATCPVCGAFEGDETAVAHHVAGHFE